jgi:hypothetical protein
MELSLIRKRLQRKSPKTLQGKINHICQIIMIREIWHCNAGWGVIYHLGENTTYKAQSLRGNKTIVFTYWDSIEQCINNEYKRIVLGQNIRGGKVEDFLMKK